MSENQHNFFQGLMSPPELVQFGPRTPELTYIKLHP